MSVKSAWIVSVAMACAMMIPQAVRAEDDVAFQAIKNHDWATAEQQLKAGLQQEPGNLSRQLNLAWVYAQTGRKEEAATLYRDILRRDRDRVASLSGHDGTPIGPLAQRGLELLNRQ